MKDFTRERKEIKFKIDADVFEAARAIPGEILAEFATKFSGISDAPPSEHLPAMLGAVEMVLVPESFKRFRTRLSDLENPIDIEQIGEVITWLLGEYGLRPTQLSSDSATGQLSPESGINSQEGVLFTESISAFSPAINS